MAKPEELRQCQTLNRSHIHGPDRGARKGMPAGIRFKELPEGWK